jgi:methionyl-tRNA formyltransferase
MIKPSKILYVTEVSEWGQRGLEAVEQAFGNSSVEAVYWSPGMPKPDLTGWQGDWIIAFKADLILPLSVLKRASKGAINFHPSPPIYRGLGGYWWALHNGDESFGVTVHHMDEEIDHGQIVETVCFPILLIHNRTVASAYRKQFETMWSVAQDPIKTRDK